MSGDVNAAARTILLGIASSHQKPRNDARAALDALVAEVESLRDDLKDAEEECARYRSVAEQAERLRAERDAALAEKKAAGEAAWKRITALHKDADALRVEKQQLEEARQAAFRHASEAEDTVQRLQET